MLRLLYCLCSCLQLWLLFYLLPRRSSSTKSSLLVWLLVFLLQSGSNDFISNKKAQFIFKPGDPFTKICCLFPCLLHSVPHLTLLFNSVVLLLLLCRGRHCSISGSTAAKVNLLVSPFTCPSQTLALRSSWNLISSEKGSRLKNWMNNFSVKIPKIHSNTSLKVHSLHPWGRNRWRWIA